MADWNGAPPEHRKMLPVRWDGTINYGHLLMTLTFIVGSLFAWADQRAELAQAQRDILALRREMEREQLRTTSAVDGLRAAIDRQGEQTRAAIERVSDKLDRKADRP